MSPHTVVTGGAGFIGSHLVRALNLQGRRDIAVVDHLNHPAKEAHLAGLDVAEYWEKDDFREAVRARRISPPATVFHFGACSSTTMTDVEYLRDNNFLYTRELCEWTLGNGGRFIYASSAATYGDGSCGYRDDEATTAVLEPLNAYGASKHRFDLWAMESGALRRAVGLKFFNVYGRNEEHKGAMRSFVHKAKEQVLRDGGVSLFRSHRADIGDGDQERDFVHVSDAVKVALFFEEHPRIGGLFNSGTGRARTWRDLAYAVCGALGTPPDIRFVDMPESIRRSYQYHTCADLARLRCAGYASPFLSVEEGVADTLRSSRSGADAAPGGVADHSDHVKAAMKP